MSLQRVGHVQGWKYGVCCRGSISGMHDVCRREGVECCELKLGDDCSFLVWVEFEREAGCGMWMGDLQVQPELMAADSVRMEVDGGDDSAMPLLDNFDSLESKVVYLGMAWCVQMLGLWVVVILVWYGRGALSV